MGPTLKRIPISKIKIHKGKEKVVRKRKGAKPHGMTMEYFPFAVLLTFAALVNAAAAAAPTFGASSSSSKQALFSISIATKKRTALTATTTEARHDLLLDWCLGAEGDDYDGDGARPTPVTIGPSGAGGGDGLFLTGSASRGDVIFTVPRDR